MNNNNAIYRELWFVAPIFKWLDKHPLISDIILVLEGLATAWAVFNYNFTTNF